MVTKRPYIFPGSERDSTGQGPDFPGSSGDREKGKFRESDIPRLTKVAVSGDDGRPIAESAEQLLAELLLWQKAMAVALSWMSQSEEFTVTEAINEASKL